MTSEFSSAVDAADAVNRRVAALDFSMRTLIDGAATRVRALWEGARVRANKAGRRRTVAMATWRLAKPKKVVARSVDITAMATLRERERERGSTGPYPEKQRKILARVLE